MDEVDTDKLLCFNLALVPQGHKDGVGRLHIHASQIKQ